MKLLSCFFLLSLFSVNVNAETISFSLEDVFTIPVGYDSNDNVEVVALAKLPNPCFEPQEIDVIKKNLKSFELVLKLKRKNISKCAEVKVDELSHPVYFTRVISLGELEHGNYTVSFRKANVLKNKTISVALATTDQIDEFDYAPVTNAFIPELVYTSDNPVVVLSGIFYSSCFDIDLQNIKVTKLGNVFVIVPKTTHLPNQSCMKNERLLEGFIDLGKISKEGSYLIHVRSQSGLSVNKVFHVRENTFSPQGR